MNLTGLTFSLMAKASFILILVGPQLLLASGGGGGGDGEGEEAAGEEKQGEQQAQLQGGGGQGGGGGSGGEGGGMNPKIEPMEWQVDASQFELPKMNEELVKSAGGIDSEPSLDLSALSSSTNAAHEKFMASSSAWSQRMIALIEQSEATRSRIEQTILGLSVNNAALSVNSLPLSGATSSMGSAGTERRGYGVTSRQAAYLRRLMPKGNRAGRFATPSARALTPPYPKLAAGSTRARRFRSPPTLAEAAKPQTGRQRARFRRGAGTFGSRVAPTGHRVKRGKKMFY